MANWSDNFVKRKLENSRIILAMSARPVFTDSTITIHRADRSFTSYIVGNVIGEGEYGWVLKVEDAYSGAYYACKVSKLQNPGSALDPIKNEIEAADFLRARPCPSCILGFDHFENVDGYSGFFMNFCSGPTLAAYLEDYGPANPLPIEKARRLCCRLVSVVAELHDAGVMHGDLKPENLIFHSTWIDGQKVDWLMLIDFGFARPLTAQTTDFVGTEGYLAPEIWRGEPHSWQVDMYALGVMLFQIVTGRHPFQELRGEDLRTAVLDDHYDRRRLLKYGEAWPALIELIQKQLAMDAVSRSEAKDALEWPCFEGLRKKMDEEREVEEGEQGNFVRV
jgi:serine/threonine protein kinase